MKSAAFKPPDEWLTEFRASNCARCPFRPTMGTTPQVYGEMGCQSNAIVFVGEAPGAMEEKVGRPFVGRSGMLLRGLLARLRIFSHQTLITNVVKCRPSDNRTPTYRESLICAPLLEWELQNIQARVIVTLGKVATSAILGKSQAISSVEGAVCDTPYGRVVPTYHPAAAARNPALTPVIMTDIKTALVADGRGTVEVRKGTPFLDSAAIRRLPDKVRELVLDIETTGLDPYENGATVRMIGAKEPGRDETWHFACEDSQRRFATWLANSLPLRVIGHNVKFDLLWLCALNILPIAAIGRMEFWDTRANYALLDEECPRKGLKALGQKLFNLEDWALENIFTDNVIELMDYNAKDLRVTEKLYDWEREREREIPWELNDVGTYVVLRMEHAGIKIDREALFTLYKEKERVLQSLSSSWPKGILNPNSIKQWREYLFTAHKERKIKKTKTGASSVDEESLCFIKETTKNKEVATAVKNLLTHRATKVSAAFVMKLLSLSDPTYTSHPGFIYPKYEICRTEHGGGTVTGRLSSHGPNLQQQSSDLLKTLRSRWEQGELVIPDLNQIEIRMLAHLSNDAALIDVCKSGDLHGSVAESVVRPLYAGKEMDAESIRRIAKTINFGVAYKISARGLMDKIKGMTLEEAETFISSWYYKFRGVAAWQEKITREVIDTGKVCSMFGRVRHLPGASKETPEGNRVIRQAINYPVQEGAAELLRNGIMPHLLRQLEGLNSLVVGNIHDALVVDIHPDEISLVRGILNDVLSNPPLPPAGIGKGGGLRWGNVSEVPITYAFKDLSSPVEFDDESEELT